jgi:hypothetical protein
MGKIENYRGLRYLFFLRFLVEKAEQVKTASIISAEGDTEAADLLASAFAKAGEGLVCV